MTLWDLFKPNSTAIHISPADVELQATGNRSTVEIGLANQLAMPTPAPLF